MRTWSLVIVALAFAATISCLKKQNLDEGDGPEISATEIQDKVLEAWGDDQPASMKAGEFSSVLTVQNLQDVKSTPLGQVGFTILSKNLNDDKSRYNYHMAIQTEEFNGASGGQSKQTTEELNFSVSKPTAATNASNSTQTAEPSPLTAGDSNATSLSMRNLADLDAGVSNTNGATAFAQSPSEKIFVTKTLYFLLGICGPHEGIKVTCHNLETHDGTLDVTKIASNCKAGSPCTANYTEVKFDLVIADPTDESKKEKYKMTAAISRDVPYLAKILSFCQRGLASLTGSDQKVIVTLCQSVNNYQVGQ